MELDQAYSLISRAIDAGKPANAYLVSGGIRGMAMELATKVLGYLFPDASAEGLKSHPDVHWLHPESKSRIINIGAMHEQFIEPLSHTSYAGGWKAGVVVGADCLNQASANAFLKTLEEPPPKTLFLLLSDAPEKLMPTIVSRCQRVDLPDSREHSLPEPWRTETIEALSDKSLSAPPPGVFVARAAAAERLAGILASLKEKAENDVSDESGGGPELSAAEDAAIVSSRYREYRREFLFTVMDFFAERMRVSPGASAFANVEAVEDLARSLDCSMNESSVLSFFMDRIRLS